MEILRGEWTRLAEQVLQKKCQTKKATQIQSYLFPSRAFYFSQIFSPSSSLDLSVSVFSFQLTYQRDQISPDSPTVCRSAGNATLISAKSLFAKIKFRMFTFTKSQRALYTLKMRFYGKHNHLILLGSNNMKTITFQNASFLISLLFKISH